MTALLAFLLAGASAPPFLFSGPAEVAPGFGKALDAAAQACGYDPEAFQWSGKVVRMREGTASHVVQLRLQPDERTRPIADCVSGWMKGQGYGPATPGQAAAFVGAKN